MGPRSARRSQNALCILNLVRDRCRPRDAEGFLLSVDAAPMPVDTPEGAPGGQLPCEAPVLVVSTSGPAAECWQPDRRGGLPPLRPCSSGSRQKSVCGTLRIARQASDTYMPPRDGRDLPDNPRSPQAKDSLL